jgi:tetratricopeptide (TPR) repeat protein/predicted Ser/Thr protein kinase
MSVEVETIATLATNSASLPGEAQPLALLDKGAALGRYLVLERLGMGGMGVVYAAYDPQLDRKVAIKLVRPARRGGSQGGGRMRLLREAQAMAKLSHPNVVAVHDVGMVDEQVFVAMAFIDGPSLRAWLEASPRSWSEVLERFRQAGRGLAAAHAHDLIHRDFKPDNVMIGGEDRVVVMDFGLVRARSSSNESQPGSKPEVRDTIEPGSVETDDLSSAPLALHLTEVGRLLGTPAYMAPEQLGGGEADARSDQFSFCVALYEALYGERPFVGKSIVHLATAILEGTIQPEPRTSLVPRWLRAVVVRGLANDPEARFASMNELLEALARDPSQRRRTRVLAATAGTLCLLAVGLGWLFVEHRREQAYAVCDAVGREIDEVWNDESRAALEHSLGGTGSPLATTSFTYMRAWLDPWTARWTSERTATCVRAELDETLGPELYAQSVACFDEQRERLAAMLDVFALSDTRMVASAGKAAAAFSQLESCADERALARRPELPAALVGSPQLVDFRRRLARAAALADAGDYSSAQRLAEEALAIARSLEWKPLEAEALLVHAAIASEIGNYTQVHEQLLRAFNLASSSGSDAIAAKTAILLLRVLGYHLARSGEGLAWADVATALLERLVLAESLDAAQLANNTALVHESLGDYDETERWHLRALELRTNLLGAEHPETGHSYANLGNLSLLRNDHDAALTWHQRALDVRERGLGPSHPDVGRSHANIGRVYLARGELDEALAHFDESYAIFSRTSGAEHRVAARVLDSIAEVHRRRGELDEALAQYRRALAIQVPLLGEKHPEAALSNVGIARVLLERGELQEAFGHVEAAAIAYAELGVGHASNVELRELTGELCRAGLVVACGDAVAG